MRVPRIAVLFSLVLAAPTVALAQSPPAGEVQEVNTPPEQPASRARVDTAPTLLERMFSSRYLQQQQAETAPQQEPQAAEAERPRRRADRRRSERRAERRLRSPRREARREARRQAQREAAPAAEAEVAARPATEPVPIPPQHPERATEQAVATVDGSTVATSGVDPTTIAYTSADDPRERCHVVLASEAEHDIAEVLRCRVLLDR